MKNLGNDRFMKKLERVTEIQDLVAQGVTNISEIARHFNIRWETAKAELKLGNIIFNYQLSPENIAKRRMKINNKMEAVALEAFNQYTELIRMGAVKEALGFYKVHATIWCKHLPELWGLLNGVADAGCVSPVTVDTVQFNKIDLTVTKENVEEAEEKVYELAENAGIRIK